MLSITPFDVHGSLVATVERLYATAAAIRLFDTAQGAARRSALLTHDTCTFIGCFASIVWLKLIAFFAGPRAPHILRCDEQPSLLLLPLGRNVLNVWRAASLTVCLLSLVSSGPRVTVRGSIDVVDVDHGSVTDRDGDHLAMENLGQFFLA